MQRLRVVLACAVLAQPSASAQSLTNGAWTYSVTNGSATILSYGGVGGAVAIPAVLDGIPVRVIGGGGTIGIFGASNSSATSVDISEGVTSIANYAFQRSTGLARVSIPATTTNIGDYAFAYCSALDGLVLPAALQRLGSASFGVCSSLSYITIPASVTNIPFAAFAYCTNLAGATIPASVTSIGDGAFNFCTRLSGVLFAGVPPVLLGTTNIFLNNTNAVYRLPEAAGWTNTYSGRPVVVFAPAAGPSAYASPGVFQFSWTGTGAMPMNVQRRLSMDGGAWAVVSSNNSAGSFTDTNAPADRAFYRATLP